MLPFKDLVDALGCANAVIEGTAGGYTPTQKQKAKQLLSNLEVNLVSKWRGLSCDPEKVTVEFNLIIQK